MSNLYVKKLYPDSIVPTRAHDGQYPDVGLDLYSYEERVIEPKCRALVPTGIAVGIPEGCYGRVASKSGLACNKSIDVGAGVIDRGYTDDIRVCLINSGNLPFFVSKGMKIAQLICEKVEYPVVVCVSELPKTARGSDGFGSSGC